MQGDLLVCRSERDSAVVPERGKYTDIPLEYSWILKKVSEHSESTSASRSDSTGSEVGSEVNQVGCETF
jgi:hypothetical protein